MAGPPGEDTLRNEARKKFWLELAKTGKSHEMLEALQREVLPIYRRYAKAHHCIPMRHVIEPVREQPSYFYRHVKDWAKRYGLLWKDEVPDWVLDTVESTLLDWSLCSCPPLVWSRTGEYIRGQKTRKHLPPEHQFRWSIQFQVEGLSVREILARDPTCIADVALVNQGIDHVLTLIGISRRPGTTGRPRKV